MKVKIKRAATIEKLSYVLFVVSSRMIKKFKLTNLANAAARWTGYLWSGCWAPLNTQCLLGWFVKFSRNRKDLLGVPIFDAIIFSVNKVDNTNKVVVLTILAGVWVLPSRTRVFVSTCSVRPTYCNREVDSTQLAMTTWKVSDHHFIKQLDTVWNVCVKDDCYTTE